MRNHGLGTQIYNTPNSTFRYGSSFLKDCYGYRTRKVINQDSSNILVDTSERWAAEKWGPPVTGLGCSLMALSYGMGVEASGLPS